MVGDGGGGRWENKLVNGITSRGDIVFKREGQLMGEFSAMFYMIALKLRL